jgi:MFS family permease
MSTIGIADGFYFSASLAICQKIFSSSRLVNQAMGYFYTFMAIPIIIGPIIAALIFEKFGSYYWGFLHGGIACLLCFAIQIFYPNGMLVKYFKCKSKDIRI